MLARVVPDVPCTVLLDADEWQGLYCRIHRVAVVPPKPPTLRQVVRWIAQLGGFVGRKRDGEPGVTVLWKGFQKLVDIAAMYRIMRPAPLSGVGFLGHTAFQCGKTAPYQRWPFCPS